MEKVDLSMQASMVSDIMDCRRKKMHLGTDFVHVSCWCIDNEIN